MKKIFTITAIAFLLASCNGNREVDIQEQLTANIDLTTMVKGMQDGNNEDYYTKSSTNPVQLNYLVYDNKGTPVYESKKTLTTFFEKVSFTTKLNPGSYTIVAWACIADDGVKPDWESDKKESLNTLVLLPNYDATFTPVLGVSKTNLEFKKSQSIDIAVPTVGCFYTILFNYSASTKAKTIACFGYRDSNSYEVGSGTSYINTAANNDYSWGFQMSVDTKYAGIYACCFILPTDLQVAWGSFDSNDNLLNRNNFTFKAEAGKHQIITVNIDTGSNTITPVKSSALLENTGKPQAIEIGKMKAEPAKISFKLN